MKKKNPWPMKNLFFGAALLLVLALMWLAGQPLISAQPLPIQHNGVHAPYTVRNRQGELLFFNFRAVEPKQLYRGSAFVPNRVVLVEGRKQARPAAFADSQAFDWLRERGIRTIICLQEAEICRAEKSYFDQWGKKTGYHIDVRRLTVRNGHAYDTDSALLERFPEVQDRRTGLRAAADFIEFMKRRKPGDGAVYVHDDTGKDSAGVVCAGYELWRNRGTADADTLWDQVMNRYLVSNVVIERDKEAARLAGGKTDCDFSEAPNYVCTGRLQKVRPQLELIAQL